MTNYTKSTNFTSKDSLASGNTQKIVRGTELDTEFNNISTAVNTKAELLSPTFTGIPLAPTAASGTSTTQIATTAFTAAAIAVEDAIVALKAPLASPTLTGTPTSPTADVDTNTTQLATTAFVIGQAATSNPLANGVAAVGTSKRYARQDHVHAESGIGIGIGQAWQNLTSSRVLGTTYLNNSGKPIYVCVSQNSSGNNTAAALIANTHTIIGSSFNGPSSNSISISFIVPDGISYSVFGGSSLSSWFELR